jgi:hypothetical protein
MLIDVREMACDGARETLKNARNAYFMQCDVSRIGGREMRKADS